MDPNQEGQPAQGGSVPPTSPAPGMPPAQAGGSPAPTSGMPPAQPAGTPPAGSPVFGAQGTTTAADPSPTPVSTPAPAPGVLPASGAPATPPLTPRRSFRPASAGAAQAGAGSQFAQPDPSQPGSQIIASGNLPTAGNGKKPSRNLIIAIVAVAVLAIVAVIIGIVASNSSGSRSNSSSSTATTPVNMTELATAYNNLANYIAFGDENQGEKKIDGKEYSTNDMLNMALSMDLFGDFLKADTMLSSDYSSEKIGYFATFDQLYERLPGGISDAYDIDVPVIYDYYHGFSAIPVLSVGDIVSRYNAEGLESTRNYINNTVATSSDKDYVQEYAAALRDSNLATLDLADDVKINTGCVLNQDNSNKCNLKAASSYSAFLSTMENIQFGDAYKLRLIYHGQAVRALIKIGNILGDNTGGAP